MVQWFAELRKKEKVLWGLFCFTCFQLATKFPDIKVVPGERTKVFSALLCGITLFALVVVKRKEVRFCTPEWVVCIILSFLCVVSGVLSSDPSSSLWRSACLIFSAVGGFWCGRLLLNQLYPRFLFSRLSLVFLPVLYVVGIAGYFLHDNVLHFADVHKHIFNDLILLLSFGPLFLLLNNKKLTITLGVFYLLVGYYVISLSFDPLVWFPPLLFLGAILFRLEKKKRIIIPLLLLIILASIFTVYKIPKRFIDKENISVWVRVENVFFSYHIAKKRPFLGIGLVAPRLKYLNDYSIVYPHVTKEQFAEVLPEENRSSENQILTFMCDLGFPFLLLYSFSVLILYKNLIQIMRQKRRAKGINPIVLWIPITGALLHFQFFDGLLHPQTSWFFHILLGMIPLNSQKPPASIHEDAEKLETQTIPNDG